MARQAVLSNDIINQVNVYARVLRQAQIPVEHLIVFGSHVKGTALQWSDIDLCVVSKTFGSDRFSDRVRLSHLTNDETMDIEPHPMSPEELADPWDPLAHEIRTHGIKVV